MGNQALWGQERGEGQGVQVSSPRFVRDARVNVSDQGHRGPLPLLHFLDIHSKPQNPSPRQAFAVHPIRTPDSLAGTLLSATVLS